LYSGMLQIFPSKEYSEQMHLDVCFERDLLGLEY
jgi:hypothetical protein